MAKKSDPTARLIRISFKPPSLALRLIKIILRLAFRRKVHDISEFLKLRKKWERYAFFLRLAPGVTCTPFTYSFFQAEWLIPKNQPLATIFYIHGGGYCLGSHKTHRAFLSYLCRLTNTSILSFDYRLAPEYPFPAALKDAIQMYEWCVKQMRDSSVYMAGDSAGGGLVLALLLALKKENAPLPKGVICFSPWLDLAHQGKTLKTNQKTDILLHAPSLPVVGKLYRGDEDPYNPLLSPLYGNWDNLPPIFIQAANEEILLSDSLRLYKKVKKSKGIITLEIWKDRFHAWPYFAPFLPEAREAIFHVKAFLEKNEAL